MKRAILSVHDKTGIVELGKGLHDLGFTLIASGGTAKLLMQNGLPVKEVSDYTGSPEMLGGRVKTLHPAIHGGLLARPTDSDEKDLQKQGYGFIDLVAVNLYPFEETIRKPGVTPEEVIENIDIGGVTLIRAAAKNHERVTLLCDPRDYVVVLEELRSGGIKPETRKRLAIKGFATTARYDSTISAHLNPDGAAHFQAYPVQKLRYGENPHQSATLYTWEPGAGPLGGRVLQGKELSYNNLLDLDAAWRAAVSFDRPTIAIVKHLSPCGVASGDDLTTAYKAALASDPISAFGGVIACNKIFDARVAESLGDLFVECIASPGFSDEAKELLAKRKQCRLLQMPNVSVEPRHELRSVTRGILKQDLDLGDPSETQWKVVSKREPSEKEWTALRFAWKVCAHVKSNAIVFAQGEATVGIGGGQPNRVDCVRIAGERAAERSKGAVMASDAFFPFPDSVQSAAKFGITAVVHPGGSIRDKDSIAAADEAGMAMVVTGVRHFRH